MIEKGEQQRGKIHKEVLHKAVPRFSISCGMYSSNACIMYEKVVY